MTALYVFDYFLNKSGLYSQLEKEPQLFNHLLNSKSFASFHINSTKNICSCLVGPYYLILTHVSTTHNLHIGSKQCHWCDDAETKAHIEDHTLQCYDKYLLSFRNSVWKLIYLAAIGTT